MTRLNPTQILDNIGKCLSEPGLVHQLQKGMESLALVQMPLLHFLSSSKNTSSHIPASTTMQPVARFCQISCDCLTHSYFKTLCPWFRTLPICFVVFKPELSPNV